MRRLILLCLVLGSAGLNLIAQDKGPAKKAAGTLSAVLTEAIKGGKFVLDGFKKVYRLQTDKPIIIDKSDHAASNETRSVDVEIGTYEGKPAFVTLVGSQKTIEGTSKPEAVKTLEGLDVQMQPLMKCPHKKVCVKICKDSSGAEYCCEWACPHQSP